MKIEILFPERCNLFGDMSNMKYLQQCLPEAEFVRTSMQSEPAFVQEKVDLIYMGPMSESAQERVVRKLTPYKEALQQQIDSGTVMLFTGNALEVLGDYMENEDGSRVEGLHLFPIWAKRDLFHRFNGLVLGEFEDMQTVGFQTQFTKCYGDVQAHPFVKVKRGMGMNHDAHVEGIHKNNFFGTYQVGPFLVLNPLFTKYLLGLMGVKEPKLAHEHAVMEAYQQRLKEFCDPNVKID